ncbi:glycosyltransferase [Nitratiruptor sp. SB155-2]|uniref:glycosyltransferase n=1 Tax=Nitratiruptor sp. (strain SB155-2) TaxID=387092 RepID=UPI00015873FF|nr:glycosyltransferase [Nitratiruptor sp. SB155-2]BAF70502.1 glycosyl transferase [Nitratiruptor sp. SB155-2]
MLYIDVTSLMCWNRAPVGIIKTQLELVRYTLQNDLANYTFFDKDGKSIHRVDESHVRKKIESIENNTSYAFNLSSAKPEKPSPSFFHLADTLHEAKVWQHPFTKEDVYISIGLDWDYSDYEILYWIKKEIGFSFVGALYDLIPVTHPQYVASFGFSQLFTKHILNLIYLSDKIFCISDFSKSQLQAFVQTNNIQKLPIIKTIHLGDNIPKSVNLKLPQRPHDPNNFCLYVSTVEARKNHILLLRLYDALIQENIDAPDLVCVGMRGWGVDEVFSFYESRPYLKNRVYFYEDVSDGELHSLYQQTRFSLFPSHIEGWGLASRESLLFGKPVLISEAEALKEATQGLALSLPNDIDYWIEAFEMVQSDTLLQEWSNMIQSRFRPRSWEEFAQEFITFVKEEQ